MKKIIKELRLSMGLTQKEFAEQVGVSVSAVKAWELGYNYPTPVHAKRIYNIKKLIDGSQTPEDLRIEELKKQIQRKYFDIKIKK